VVVPGRHAARVAATVASVQRAAGRSGLRTQVLVAWQGDTEPPTLTDALVRPTFGGLGGAYAVNRCLELAVAPLLVVLHAGRTGDDWARAAADTQRRRRTVTPVLDTQRLRREGGLDQALPLVAAVAEAAARGGPAAPALRRAGRLLVRAQERRPSARRPLSALPESLGLDRAELISLAASARAKNHLMYACPGGRVLHLYADPSPRLLRGTQERERVRAQAPRARVPRLHAAVPGRDCLWVLEEEVPGQALAGPPVAWWSEASEWLVDLAGPAGPPLSQTPQWPAVVGECLASVPDGSRGRADLALHAAGRLPSRHQHGDLQPKNVVRTPDGLAAVDWEGVWLEGVPGLDLLFLALLAVPGWTDPELLPALLRGQDSRDRPVRPALRRLGVADDDVPALVTACLAQWTRGEARRRSQLGAPLTRQSSTWFTQQWAGLPVT
jgi:hypothetical protein